MLNERDDNKYENPEESEYHFSDEEVSYEVETESPKAATPSDGKESVLNRLTRSRRMLISLAVFLVLVFVVYKMVAPTSTTPTAPTDITTPVTAEQKPMTTTTVTTTMQQPPAVLPVANNVAPSAPAVAPTNNLPVAPVAVATTTATTAPQQAPQQAPVIVQTNTGTAVPEIPGATPTVTTTQVTQTPAVAVQQYPQQAPAVVQPAQTQSTTTTTVTQPTAPVAAPPVVVAESPMSALAAENQKLANQLQSEYAQKINDYSSQNKAMQDQIQTLSARVASMETQMNQLIQTLTRQANPSATTTTTTTQVAQPERSEPTVRVPYNVQAIIPGRAWLRSDSGETVTVAEGDMVKDVGRVTKIDPYDGVVEINTGTKVVSLSYGNGA